MGFDIGFGETLVAVLAVFGIFILPVGSVAFLLYYLLKTRNNQRMEMLRQGLVPSSQMKAAPNKFTSLRNGCLFLGLAVGIIMGLTAINLLECDDMSCFLIMLSSSILFLGVGYIVFYFLVKNKNTDEE